MTQVRICIITQYFPPDMGGACTRVLNALKGLKKREADIVVVTAFPHYPHGKIPDHYKRKAFLIEKDKDNTRIVRVWIPSIPHTGFMKRLLLYISFTFSSMIALPFVGKVDVVWAVSPNFFVFPSGALYKLVKRASLVLDVVDLWPQAPINLGYMKMGFVARIAGFVAGFSHKFSDAVVTLHLTMKKEIVKSGVEESKVHVVENVVDADLFRPLKVERPISLEKKFIAMYSGNLGPAYDFESLLEAARILFKHKDIALLLRGDGECRDEIMLQLSNSKLGNVHLLTDVVDLAKVVEYLNWADVFLLPMKKVVMPEASLPLKLLEYLSCGKPVISSGEGESANLIQASEAGLTIEPQNPKALARAVLSIAGDEGLRRKMGQSGRQYVYERLSCDKMGEKLYRVFESTLKK